MDTLGKRLGRIVVVVVGTALAAVVGWVLFVRGPGNLAALLGVVLTLAVALLGARFASNIAEDVFAPYNVAEVPVEGPIQRESGSSLPNRPNATPADEIVDQIDAADEDDNVDGLVVHLNTPGGEVVPSDDIRAAAASFEGPTVAYATDTCASGGYWIASACGTIVAREGSIVGSIGVLASRVTAGELLNRAGLQYERLVAGDYKDAGVALRDMEQDEREYLQGIVDDYYETFLERVTDGRDLEAEAVQETEAKVFLGPEAKDRGLVDEIGTKEAVEEYLEEELEESVAIKEFEPAAGFTARLRQGAASLAFAFGAGVTAALTDGEADAGVPNIRF